MKIEAGKFYRTRDGRKVGPILYGQPHDPEVDGDQPPPWPFRSGDHWYKIDGFSCPGSLSDHTDKDDLIAEWTDEPAGPVRTRTVTEIVPGVYGRIEVYAYRDGTAGIRPRLEDGGVAGESFAALNAAELRAAAAVFVQLADALEGGSA